MASCCSFSNILPYFTQFMRSLWAFNPNTVLSSHLNGLSHKNHHLFFQSATRILWFKCSCKMQISSDKQFDVLKLKRFPLRIGFTHKFRRITLEQSIVFGHWFWLNKKIERFFSADFLKQVWGQQEYWMRIHTGLELYFFCPVQWDSKFKSKKTTTTKTASNMKIAYLCLSARVRPKSSLSLMTVFVVRFAMILYRSD